MIRATVTAVLAAVALLIASPGFTQSTRTEQVEEVKSEKAAQLLPPTREAGDLVVSKVENFFRPDPPAARLTFGDFRPGAGLALGALLEVPVGERGMWTGTGAVSINRFKDVATSIAVPPFTTDRVRVRATARWEDAPDLSFFGIGMDTAPSGEMTYGLRSTDVGGDVRVRGPWRFGYGAVLKYTRVESNDGAGDVPAIADTSLSEWLHSEAYAEIDTRLSPGYTTTGGLYHVSFHDYAGRDSAPSFRRTEIDLRQFVPVLHDNWIVALQARADLTASANGLEVPFFMMPSIGGRDTLPGFENYRFTDRNSLLLRGELRWTASPIVDMAAFVDTGTVAARVGLLDLHDMQHSWGIGARIHGPSYTALRLQVAHSVEGWRYNIAQGVSF